MEYGEEYVLQPAWPGHEPISLSWTFLSSRNRSAGQQERADLLQQYFVNTAEKARRNLLTFSRGILYYKKIPKPTAGKYDLLD